MAILRKIQIENKLTVSSHPGKDADVGSQKEHSTMEFIDIATFDDCRPSGN